MSSESPRRGGRSGSVCPGPRWSDMISGLDVQADGTGEQSGLESSRRRSDRLNRSESRPDARLHWIRIQAYLKRVAID